VAPTGVVPGAKCKQAILIESEEIMVGESRFFTVEGGRGGQMQYRSIESLATLEKRFPHLAALLSTDLFHCRVLLKRADISGTKKAWTPSEVGRFGKCSEEFPQSDVALLKGRWSGVI